MVPADVTHASAREPPPVTAPYVQGSAEWHATRAMCVGASEVAALFGEQPDYALSHYALWQVKAGRTKEPGVGGKRAGWGLRLEPAIAEAVACDTGWHVEKGGHATHADYPGLGASLDYLFHDGTSWGVLDCKNVDRAIWYQKWTDDSPPTAIQLQVQAQLACTGLEHGAIGCLIGGNDLRIYRYKRRQKTIDLIRERVATFWLSIAEGKPPPIDGRETTTAALQALHPVDPSDVPLDLTADNEIAEICFGLIAATADRKAAEAIEDGFKNRLSEKLQGRKKAFCNGYRISVAVTAAKEARPARPGEIISGRKESRRLIVTENHHV